jgi:hypothetical protein
MLHLSLLVEEKIAEEITHYRLGCLSHDGWICYVNGSSSLLHPIIKSTPGTIKIMSNLNVGKRIAMTDRVYTVRDCNERASGCDYIYRVMEELSSPSCCYQAEVPL